MPSPGIQARRREANTDREGTTPIPQLRRRWRTFGDAEEVFAEIAEERIGIGRVRHGSLDEPFGGAWRL
jgi:hypothetical protein